MIIAFSGADGRSAAAHAAYSVGLALTAAGRPATLLRIAERGQGLARIPETMPEALRLVEGAPDDLPARGGDPMGLVARDDTEGRDVILDVPLAWLDRDELREAAALSVVVVGPAPMDERIAASALERRRARSADGPSASGAPGAGMPRTPPVWLLGAGRSGGGPDAARFGRAMRALLGHGGAVEACRFLPVALPEPTRSEARAVTAGYPLAGTVRHGILLLAAIEVAAQDPYVDGLDGERFAHALGLGPDVPVSPDERRLSERLRDLADGLEVLEREGPDPEELANAPLMESWSFRTGRTPVIAGISFGHPTVASGRPTFSSDVFATDGRTWAQTLSRLWRLGTPAESAGATGLQ